MIVKQIIYQCVVGSEAIGCVKKSDCRQFIGIYIESLRDMIAGDNLPQYRVHPTTTPLSASGGAQSQNNYSLRYFIANILTGKSWALLALFDPDSKVWIKPGWPDVRLLKNMLISKQLVQTQLAELATKRLTILDINPDIKARYGKSRLRYSADDAANWLQHCIVLTNILAGKMYLPLSQEDLLAINLVKEQLVEYDDFYKQSRYVLEYLGQAVHTSTIPAEPETEKAYAWVVQIYETHR